MNPKQVAGKLALKRLFTQGYFSICVIDELKKTFNLIPDKEVYRCMSLVHCVNYSDMEPEFREWLYNATLDMFSCEGFPLDNFSLVEAKSKAPIVKEVIKEVEVIKYVEQPRKKRLFGFLN